MTTKQTDPLMLAIKPGSIVPVDIETTAALCGEVRRLHELLENKQAELLRIKAHAEMRRMEDEAMLDAMKQKIRTLELANELYEAALKAGFPEGAKGEVFYNWNEARYLTGRSYLGVTK